MQPISPEEISALIDGELAPERWEQVRLAIGNEESLRRIYEQLSETDKALTSFATACQFEPQISLPETSPVLAFPASMVAFGLLVVRVLAKILPHGPGILLQVLMIGLLAAWLCCWLLPALRADRWQVARELGEVAR